MPAAAKVKSEAGAIAFVKYFLELNNTSWMAADPLPLKQVSDKSCGACQNLMDTAADLKAKGQHYSSPVVRLDAAKGSGTLNGTQLIDARVTQLRSSVVDSSGKVVLTDPEQSVQRTFRLIWNGSTWSVVDLG